MAWREHRCVLWAFAAGGTLLLAAIVVGAFLLPGHATRPCDAVLNPAPSMKLEAPFNQGAPQLAATVARVLGHTLGAPGDQPDAWALDAGSGTILVAGDGLVQASVRNWPANSGAAQAGVEDALAGLGLASDQVHAAADRANTFTITQASPIGPVTVGSAWTGEYAGLELHRHYVLPSTAPVTAAQAQQTAAAYEACHAQEAGESRPLLTTRAVGADVSVGRLAFVYDFVYEAGTPPQATMDAPNHVVEHGCSEGKTTVWVDAVRGDVLSWATTIHNCS